MSKIRYSMSVAFMVTGLLLFFQNCSAPSELQILSHPGTHTASHQHEANVE